MLDLGIDNFQSIQDELTKALAEIRQGSDKVVTIGIHEGAGAVESGDLTMAGLGAVHEFGAKINHPGGTSYGYATKAAADRNEVRFLASGTGYMELGVTQPHNIDIPARPWLEPGVAAASQEVVDTILDGIEAGRDFDTILEGVGVVASGRTRVYMTELRTPPNAASTIRQKGSDNPLIDTGAMRASVTHAVQDGPLSEGLE